MHAVIERDADVTLIDLGTDGGTFVNDAKVKRTVLKSGDLIRFGGAQVIVVF
jgi:pSer/pThr/pTyr-binding forkhead associated (FHA) protein